MRKPVEHLKLDRRSQAYLATQAGLTQEEAALAFAQNNRGVSLDQIKKKSAEAEKKQLSQAEAMQKLAGSIERLVKSGGGGAKTLFGAFVEGFQQAIFRSREFRQIMRNIRQMLRSTRMAGRQVGRAFIEMFPGVKNILGGLADLFSPTRWKATLNKVVDAFKDFFKQLQTNPEAGLKTLFDRLKKAFFDHFDASTGAGRRIIDGYKTFFTTILKAIIGGLRAFIPIIFESLTKVIQAINGFLRGDAGIPIDPSGIIGQVKEVLTGLWETIKEAWPPLWEAMKELFNTVFEKVSAWYDQNRLKIWGFLFGPAIFRAIVGALTAELTKAFVVSMTGAAGSTAITSAATTAMQTVSQAAAAGIAAQTAAIQALTVPPAQVNGWRLIANEAIKSFGTKLLLFAAALSIGGIMFAGAVKVMGAILEGMTQEQMLLVFETLGMMLLSGIALYPIVKAFSVIPWEQLTAGLKGAAIGFALIAVTALAWLVCIRVCCRL